MNRITMGPESSLRALLAHLAGIAVFLLGAVPVRAAPTIQRIITLGDTAGDVVTKRAGAFEIGPLNDNGQIAFTADNAAGGRRSSNMPTASSSRSWSATGMLPAGNG
jgi:hypothetical protein